MKVKVLVRVWRSGGDAIALFPELPGTNDPYTCLSYEVVGQHGAADPLLCQAHTRKPGPGDRDAVDRLLADLRRAGYDLQQIHRMPSRAVTVRRQAIAV